MSKIAKESYNVNLHMFVEDFCHSYSSSFSLRNFAEDPYYVLDNFNLKELLTYNNYDFFRYDYDRILTEITRELILNGIAYVEIVEKINDEENLVGLDLHVLDHSLTKKRFNTYVAFEKSNSHNKRRINRENIVVLKLSDVGISKIRVKRILNQIKKVNLPSTELMLSNSNVGFDWEKFKNIYDYKQLSVCKELYWYFRSTSNPLFSECYLVYRIAKFDELRQNFYYYIKERINESLVALGEKTGFKGTIAERWNKIDYSECLNKLKTGEYNTSQAGDILFNRISN